MNNENEEVSKMKFEQKVVIKIIDMENDDIDFYEEFGMDFGMDNDELSPMEQGFLLGYMCS